jgi:apolipoprotein N-acyltransferase
MVKSPADNLIGRVLLTLASAGLLALAFPPWGWGWLAWGGLAPLLLALRGASLRLAGWLGALFGMAFYGLTLTWFREIFGSAAVSLWAILTLPLIGWALSYAFLQRRVRPLALCTLTPVLWVGWDLFRCEGWYFRFSWLQLGFSQTTYRPILQVVSVIGVYGLSFLIVAVNAGLAFVVAERGYPRRWWVLSAAVALPLLLAGGGWVRLQTEGAGIAYRLSVIGYRLSSPEGTPSLKPKTQNRKPSPGPVVGVVQDESGQIEEYEALTRQLKNRRPALVVWPECALMEYPLEQPRLLARLQRLARDLDTTLVVGCKEAASETARLDWLRARAFAGERRFYNTALLLSPQGRVLGSYHKAHPIPFFLDGVPGGENGTILHSSFRTPDYKRDGTNVPDYKRVFATEAGQVGVAICFDFDFAHTSRQLVRNGAELLVVPTYDAADWGAAQHLQHSAMIAARAVEHRRAVVRAASSGISQIVGPDGALLAQVPNLQSGAASAAVPLVQGLTFHDRAGYLLPYLCAGATLGLWLLGAWRRFRPGPQRRPGSNVTTSS